jgi:phosphatidylinositol-3-phosphatase
LFRQTLRAHRPWKGYAESMPARCEQHSAGRYAARHNPAVYYTDVRRACRSRDVPLGSHQHGLRHDLATNQLPWFAFVTPNLCHDMHDCSTAVGNRWLGRWLPRIFRSTAWKHGRTALFVTFDEGAGSESGSACSRARRKDPSCHVATWVFGPAVRPGTRVNVRFTHYSLLRTTEAMLGLPFLGHARHARGMRHAFRL